MIGTLSGFRGLGASSGFGASAYDTYLQLQYMRQQLAAKAKTGTTRAGSTGALTHSRTGGGAVVRGSGYIPKAAGVVDQSALMKGQINIPAPTSQLPLPPGIEGGMPISQGVGQAAELPATVDDTLFGMPRMVVIIGGILAAVAAVAGGYFFWSKRKAGARKAA